MSNAKKRIRQQLPKDSQTWRGKVVERGGSATVSGNPLYTWIQPEAGGQALAVYNDAVPPNAGQRVMVGRDTSDNRTRVLRGTYTLGTIQTINPNVGIHGPTHIENGTDPTWITTNQILDCKVYATTGMTVAVNPGWWMVGSAVVHVLYQEISLTANIPVAGAQYSLIRLNSSGVASVQNGTPVASYADLSDNNVPDVTAGYAALAAVRLYYGQTAISRLYADPDIIDLRFRGSGGGGSGNTVIGDVPPATCQGRLTLESGVAVSTTDQTAKTALYFTPYQGNMVGLYNGVDTWTVYNLAETTLDISAYTADKNYDIWIYDNAGTPTLDSTIWTNDTTRATALTTQDGILVKNGDTTRRYLGTIRMTATTGQCENSLTRRFVWNFYNRRLHALRATRATGGHTYTTASWRAWNNDTTVGYSTVLFVVGVVEERVNCMATNQIQSINDANMVGRLGIGINTTTANSCNLFCYMGGYTGYARMSVTAPADFLLPVAGYNYLSVNEYGNNPSITYYDVGLSAWMNA